MRVPFAVCLLLGVSAAAGAQPAAPILVAPQRVVEGTTHVFTWRAAPAATWYQLYVADPGSPSPRYSEWYTASQSHCENGGMCSVTLSTDLGVGERQWWVRPWNSLGNGSWSDSARFVLREVPKAWDALLPVAERFQLVIGNGAVLDRETGLVWLRFWSSEGHTWSQAFSNCKGQFAGPNGNQRTGFRLPTLDELSSIMGYNGLPAGHPFLQTSTDAFLFLWTSTPVLTSPTTQHWAVSAFTGTISGSFGNDTNTIRVWCVRGQGGLR